MIRDGLVELDKFAPSKRPYAFDRPSFRDGYIKAIWAGRKDSRTTASVGTLHAWDGRKTLSSFDEMIETVDMRYGGYSIAKWDGEKLITDQARPFEWCELTRFDLDRILQTFPQVPEGFEGWYYRRSS